MNEGDRAMIGARWSCLAGTARHVLGIATSRPGSAACLLRDGEVVAIAREERYSRRPGDGTFPARAIDHCLSRGGIEAEDLDYVGLDGKPLLRLERMLETCVRDGGSRSFGRVVSLWMEDEIFAERDIRRELGYGGEILYAELHESRAASAFFTSPFESAAIVTVVGAEEGAGASVGIGRGNDIALIRELRWPVSLGRLHAAVARYAGVGTGTGEAELMRLASGGEPRYLDLILGELLELHDDGSFALRRELSDRGSGTPTRSAVPDRPGGARRSRPEVGITSEERDLACSVRAVRKMILTRVARHAHRVTGTADVCLAGNVPLDHVGAFRTRWAAPFDRISVAPVGGSAAGALGIAKLVWHRHCGRTRRSSGRGSVGVAAPEEIEDRSVPHAPAELRGPASRSGAAFPDAPARKRLPSRPAMTFVIVLLHWLVIVPSGLVRRVLGGGRSRRRSAGGWIGIVGEPSPTDMERRF